MPTDTSSPSDRLGRACAGACHRIWLPRGGEVGEVEFRVLGPLEVADGERLIDLGPRMHRAVLALLLIDVNRVVSIDRLIDQLWPNETPASAMGGLQAYVHQLRRILEPGRPARTPPQMLLTQAPGYLLRVDPDAVDSTRFEALAAEGRTLLAAGRAREAGVALDRALGLWRGDPYGDLPFETFVQPEAARLQELRAAAAEDRAEAHLGVGDHRAAVAQLERLVAEQPLRERRWELLLVGLYRSGRQADALRSYAQARQTLAEELGIEPRPSLRQLEHDILIQSPSLAWRPPVAEAGAQTDPARRAQARSHSDDMGDGYLDVLLDRGPLVVPLDAHRVTIGRSRSNTVALADATVSRLHAVVERYPGGWSIRDVGSANGTFLNGKKLASERPLRHGDEITVGKARIFFRSQESEAAGATLHADGHAD